jgi:hypothetical protein
LDWGLSLWRCRPSALLSIMVGITARASGIWCVGAMWDYSSLDSFQRGRGRDPCWKQTSASARTTVAGSERDGEETDGKSDGREFRLSRSLKALSGGLCPVSRMPANWGDCVGLPAIGLLQWQEARSRSELKQGTQP